MRTVRIFVSSPGDAFDERRRVVRVIERLNADFAGTVAIERVMWEERFYSAHDSFQPQIAKPAECDVVVAILRGRLGTPLSPEFALRLPVDERLADDHAYLSGTAYEIVAAISARRKGQELPEIFVFRHPAAPSVALDAPDRAEVEAQWEKLKRFVEQILVSAEGHFKGAYHSFASTDEFEALVEGALRQWLAEHVLMGRAVVWPVATKGSPFRGLEPFGAKHADVFFGRTFDRGRAIERLKDAAEAGFPFLMVVGPSGAGKSSFVRAGLVPWLIKPGAVTGVAAWRVAVMRPGDDPGGPVAGLARRLFDIAADIPEAEKGRPVALPELADGDSPTPQALAGLFSLFARGRFERPAERDYAAAAAMAPVARALKVVAESERRAWNSDAAQPARLLLVVDQLEEIFAPGVAADDQVAFAQLLDGMARSGAVWIVATLRAEFYEAFLKSPLARLAAAQGDPVAGQTPPARPDPVFSLLPPGLAEMGEVIRGPAAAAGIAWETDPVTKQRLDERLLADIDRPDLLPLVQFVLDRLWEQRASNGDGIVLTFAAYRALGTLDGAIETAAQAALGRLGEAERATLPRLLRRLVAASAALGGGHTSAPTLRRAPVAEVAHDAASARLVKALTDARILVTDRGPDGVPVLGLAHQRVIEAWGLARTIVAESEGVLRIRDDVAIAFQRWTQSGRRRDRLIPPGLPLSEAEQAAAVLTDEFPAAVRDYVAKSSRAARLKQRLTAAAAVVFLGVAVLAVLSAVLFLKERDRAQQNFLAATQTVDGLDGFIYNANQGLQSVVGMRLDTVRKTLEQVRATVDRLASVAPADLELMRVRAGMLNNFVDVLLSAGAFREAQAAADEGLRIGQAMAAQAPADPRSLRALAVGFYKRGDVREMGNDQAGRLADDREALAAAGRLLAVRADDADARRLQWIATDKLSRAQLAAGDVKAALPTADGAVALARAAVATDPASAEHRRDLAISLATRGDAKVAGGDRDGMLADLAECLDARRGLVRDNPGNALFGRDLVLILAKAGRIKAAGGDAAGAQAAFAEALDLAAKLAAADPANARAQRDVAVVQSAMGDASRDSDKTAERAAYEDSLKTLRALVAIDSDNAGAQLDLARTLAKLALDFDDANAEGAEALAIFRRLQAEGRLAPREAADVEALALQLGSFAR